MATAQMDTVIRHLRRALLRQDGAGWTDGQLLASFIDQKDEAAFEALVRRHGPMVFGVCRRVVGNHHDTEDAFQATFLVLARKAASIRPRERVANWLHGVALRTAMKAKAMTAKRRGREKQVTEMPEPEAAQQDQWRDLQPLLDQELNGLPENYRLPILLCDLEGKTIKEAAQQLGWPQGTLAGRLPRGRKLLAKRLASRGVMLSAGSLAAVVSQNVASAVVPTSLMSSTVKAATLIAVGRATVAGVVPAKVAALMEGVIKAMLITKLKTVTVALLVVAAVSSGGGLLSRSTTAAAQTADERLPKAAGEQRADPPKLARDDRTTELRNGSPIFGVGVNSDSGRTGSIVLNEKYKSLFIKTLRVMAEHFEQITYANQYDGRIEANSNGVAADGMIREGYVNLSCDDGKCFLTVRVNKVRTTRDNSEVVGRDAEQERMILTELNAQPIQKEMQRQRFRGAGSERSVNSNAGPVTLSTSSDWPSTRRQPQQYGPIPLSVPFEWPSLVTFVDGGTVNQQGEAVETDFHTAEFYHRTGHIGAAYCYYAKVARSGDPTLAPKAREIMADLKKQYGSHLEPSKTIDQPRPQKRMPDSSEKKPARVGEIFIVGNTKTATSVILKKIPLYPGQILDPQALRTAEKNLAELSPIITVCEPTADRSANKGVGPTPDR